MESSEDLNSMLAVRDARASSGTYRDLERIARALELAAEGDFRARAQVDEDGILGRIASAANRLIARNSNLAREMCRITRRVSIEGVLHERAAPALLPGSYGDVLWSLNEVLDRLTWHAKETAAVARALEQGELAHMMPLESPDGTPLRGQPLRIARNDWVDGAHRHRLAHEAKVILRNF